MALKVIQINLNRCRLAQDIMEHNISQFNADVVIISELYRQLHYWSNGATGNSSIWITGFNGHFPTLARPVRADDISVVVVDNRLVVSCYYSPNKKLPEFATLLDALEGILVEARAPGIRVILAGDFNARSPA